MSVLLVLLASCLILTESFLPFLGGISSFKRRKKPKRKPTKRPTPNGNQFFYNTTICEGWRDYWEDPSIPPQNRNQKGRAIWQTQALVKKASKLIKKGISYDLGRVYNDNMPNIGRTFTRTFQCFYPRNAVAPKIYGACLQGIESDGLGNVGTQFDNCVHFFSVDQTRITDFDNPDPFEYVFFNNLRGTDMIGNIGIKFNGNENLPPFFTRAVLIDVVGFKNMGDILPNAYKITAKDILDTLKYQKVKLQKGDAVLINTGWGLKSDDPIQYPGPIYDFVNLPGLGVDAVEQVFWDKVMIIGSDNAPVDRAAVTARNEEGEDAWLAVHRRFLICGGGFLLENLKLSEWATNARNGNVGYVGALVFNPIKIEGAVASIGTPVVYF